MKYLFDNNGKHICNEVNGQLHSTNGKNIGHFLTDYNFYIDMNGKYLGEIVFDNRLLYKVNNAYENVNFCSYGNYGNIGNYGNPGNIGSIGTVPGFKKIDLEKLK